MGITGITWDHTTHQQVTGVTGDPRQSPKELLGLLLRSRNDCDGLGAAKEPTRPKPRMTGKDQLIM